VHVSSDSKDKSPQDTAFEQPAAVSDVSYHDVRRLALELADVTSRSKGLREAAFHFLTEMLRAIRSSGDGSSVVHLMNTSILPDVATNFRSLISSEQDTLNNQMLMHKPIQARPPQGGNKSVRRLKSAVEKRTVRGGGLTKSCIFCKQKHTINNCPVLKQYGHRMVEKDHCHHLAKTVNDAYAYYTAILPLERADDTILQSIPNKATCVIVHKRFAKNTSSTTINGHAEFVFCCTILGTNGDILNMPTATEKNGIILKPMVNSLFNDQAICQYVYKVGKSKHFISQLKAVSTTTTPFGNASATTVHKTGIRQRGSDYDIPHQCENNNNCQSIASHKSSSSCLSSIADPFDQNDDGTSTEPIHVGDEIQFYKSPFVWGDERGLERAKVLAIDPNDSCPLVLSNQYAIAKDGFQQIQRVKVKTPGDQVGFWRLLSDFTIQQEGSTLDAGIQANSLQTKEFGDIMSRRTSLVRELAEKEQFCPMDMMVEFQTTEMGQK
jgi:hypothetical protein